jgi:hypothetical protein
VVPHDPQFSASDCLFVQNAAPPPVVQASGVVAGQAHWPVEHCWPDGQTLPQLPQLLASFAVLAQYVGFSAGQAVTSTAEQVWTQVPAEQTCPAPQTVPQAPQFFGSFCLLVQKEPAPVPQASGVAAGQAHLVEPPTVEHCCPEGQVVPQAPQLLASRVRSAQ